MPKHTRKRAYPSDLPSTRQTRRRLSPETPNLPDRTDVLRSSNSPANEDAALDLDQGIFTPSEVEFVPDSIYGPAIPGIVRNREQGILSRLPPSSDAVDFFTKLVIDNNLSPEEALMKFITTHEVPIYTVNQIAREKLPASFSNVKYSQIAPYAWLDFAKGGRDILPFEIFRSRLPIDVFRQIYVDVSKAAIQYGRMEDHDNEEARSRYIASFLSELMCMFGSTITNKPECYLESEYIKKGRIEHLFYAMDSISIVIIEVKKAQTLGKAKLDIVAQVLAESITCDYANSKLRHWVPILAILCDGANFEFLVYDSGTKSVYSSGSIIGVVDVRSSGHLFVPSLKRAVEYIFDYLLMAYINGLRSFTHRSGLAATREISKKHESTGKWEDALAMAERALRLCREASELARRKRYKEAQETAIKGINELKESVSIAPNLIVNNILGLWDEASAIAA